MRARKSRNLAFEIEPIVMDSFSAGDFDSVETVIKALKEAYVHGEKQIRIVNHDRSKVSIVSLPEQEEIAALREICLEYKALTRAGFSLEVTDSDETVARFAEGVMELVDYARSDEPFRRSKQLEDVKGELKHNLAVSILGEFWESIKFKHSDSGSKKFQLVRYKTEELTRIFQNAVKKEYIDRLTRQEDFMFFFDESYDREPKGFIMWKQRLGLLSLFLYNLSSDIFVWGKASKTFKVFNMKTNQYEMVNKDSLRSLLSREKNDRDNYGDDLMGDLLA